jgi:hypothetical protein
MDKEEMTISSIVYDDVDTEEMSRKRKFAGGNRDSGVFEFNDSLQDDVINNKQFRRRSTYQHFKKRK